MEELGDLGHHRQAAGSVPAGLSINGRVLDVKKGLGLTNLFRVSRIKLELEISNPGFIFFGLPRVRRRTSAPGRAGESQKMYEKDGDGVKKHKLFAWLTVLFFLLTIITGYEKK